MSNFYYKIVARSVNGLISCNAPIAYSLVYKEGVWTKPAKNTGGIFVFKYLSDAKDFASSIDEIWKCKVKNPRKLLVRSFIDPMSIVDFWESYFSLRKKHKPVRKIAYAYPSPEGTYLASEVMLVEKCQ